MLLNFLERQFVDWQVDLEKAIRRIGIRLPQDVILEQFKLRARLMIFDQTAADFAVLIGAEKQRLIFACLLMLSVQGIDNLLAL